MRFAGDSPAANAVSALLNREAGNADDVADYVSERAYEELSEIADYETERDFLASRGAALAAGSWQSTTNSHVQSNSRYSESDYLSMYAENLAREGRLDAYSAFRILQAERHPTSNELVHKLNALVGADALRHVAVLDLLRPWELPEGVAGIGHSSQVARERLGVVVENSPGAVKSVQTRESWKGRTRK